VRVRFVLLIGLLFAVPGYGQKHFDFSIGCRQAYQEIIQLRLDEGSKLLAVEKKRDPDNLIPVFLDNYIDFFQLFLMRMLSITRPGRAGWTGVSR
jgi:hypothetical protein